MTSHNRTSVKSEFLQILIERGFLHQCTDLEALDDRLSSGIVTAYNGFDPTGPSLHVGHLLPVMLLRWFQKCGHKPIVLIGGGTARVGDPSGKDETRQLLTDADITANIDSIHGIFSRYLTFGAGATDAALVNNADWLDELKYIPFLRDIGRHFTINRMLTFDSVRMRLEREHPLTFLEFNYMILQAYDFLELYRNQGCTLQLGGSDQWGNIVNGVELGRRIEQASLYGLTVPLITTSDGSKMGKTARGAVWLKEDMLSAYDYWQFWRNVSDPDVGRFLRLFTELPLDEIRRLEALQGVELNEAKKILATEATTLAHGVEAARSAGETARQTFEEQKSGANLPTIEIPSAALAAGIGILDLYLKAGLCASKGEARRLVRQGGARINDETVEDETLSVTTAMTDDEGLVKLSAGKKRHALVKPV